MESKTILFVEDHLEFLAIYKLYLERQGYHVVVAEDGENAVRFAREYRPDLILMDFSMPGLDGIGATQLIKSDPETEQIPVVLLTAHAYGSVGRRAREAGCAAFIRKPCDPRRVLDEVEHWIGAPAH
ncbi:MAG TPA: response regulator [Longimicrobiaceae bacterium]|nr:response regulator [Longimicrobiaceae bacterium]